MADQASAERFALRALTPQVPKTPAMITFTMIKTACATKYDVGRVSSVSIRALVNRA